MRGTIDAILYLLIPVLLLRFCHILEEKGNHSPAREIALAVKPAGDTFMVFGNK